jgi:N-acylneuraminate cytidylyltransferase
MYIALVPMRSGSKGVPHKNIRDFCGEPLFYWNISALIKAEVDVWVSTDSLKYKRLVEDVFNGCVNVFMRSERTAKDDAVTIEVVQEFIEKQNLHNDDIFLLSQVTSPYLKPEDVKGAIQAVEQAYTSDDKKIESIMSVGITHRYLYNDDGTCINFAGRHVPRQKWAGTKVQNGCLYCTTVGAIRKYADYFGGVRGFLVQEHEFEIDTQSDWEKGEAEMRGILNGCDIRK